MSVERWGVWRANLDPVVGPEQGLTRPVRIVITAGRRARG